MSLAVERLVILLRSVRLCVMYTYIGIDSMPCRNNGSDAQNFNV